jgi:hypothetical protein
MMARWGTVLALLFGSFGCGEAARHAENLEEGRLAVLRQQCMIAAVQGGLSDAEADAWVTRCVAACPQRAVAAIYACVETQARSLPPTTP